MTNIEAARQNARKGAELGDLRRNSNDAALKGWQRQICELSELYMRLKDADDPRAAEVRAEGLRLINERYGL